ncbi:MAG: glycerophosphodiester phosphodiesterase [Flavobacteriales bacterium]|nr:glycerophosphodiester phosphodiesterase [Flavobacteriales bacterium]
MPNEHPEVSGHRGCRGLLPENTIPGFIKATELGVDWLELDVVISGDGQVVVSHEPWISHRICLRPGGDSISVDEERSLNLFRMGLSEIQGYDCGSLAHPDFPGQATQRAYKPTLREVVETVDEHAMNNSLTAPGFMIEIKSDPAFYGVYQPIPAEFARVVVETIDSLGIADRCVVQSFDPAVLEVMHAERPDITLAFLVENEEGWKENLKRLSFEPDIYSPHFSLIDARDVEKLHGRNVEVVVWTVNDEEDIRKLLALGVDGIISDYPDRVIGIVEAGD